MRSKRCATGAVSRAVLWLFFFAVVPALQLPPEIQADRYLLEAEKKIQEQNFEGAKDAMDRILKLEVQHGLEIPEEFFFRYAEVSERLGLYEEVVEFVTKYLTLAGRDAKHYREALELLIAAEPIVEAARRKAEEEKRKAEAAAEARRRKAEEEKRKAEAAAEAKRRKAEKEKRGAEAAAAAGAVPTCAEQTEGSACWMELEGRPSFCYMWNPYLRPDVAVTWTGKCSGGLAHGTGTVTWVWDGGKKTVESTGSLTGGKSYGQWVERLANGGVHEGPSVDGKRHGQWVERLADGGVHEGPYVEGKKHGRWVESWADGDVWEGPYVDGKLHGDWVLRAPDGRVHEGPYVEGKKHGRWVESWADGDVWEGPYVDGKRHGQWVKRLADGGVHEGPYVDGKLHGDWVLRAPDGRVQEGPYVDGKRHGRWVESWADGDVWEGPYVDGKRHGQWVERLADGRVHEGPYVDDKRHGKWLRRSPIAGKKNRVRVSVRIYENGEYVRDGGTRTERVSKKK